MQIFGFMQKKNRSSPMNSSAWMKVFDDNGSYMDNIVQLFLNLHKHKVLVRDRTLSDSNSDFKC